MRTVPTQEERDSWNFVQDGMQLSGSFAPLALNTCAACFVRWTALFQVYIGFQALYGEGCLWKCSE